VDAPARLLSAVPPPKLDVNARAVVAIYVDAKGTCHGAAPVELPFPDIFSELTSEIIDGRYEPARAGKKTEPSWMVVEIGLSSRIKESRVVEQTLEPPDPETPPQPAPPPSPPQPGRLVALPVTPPSLLSAPASPKKLNVGLPSRDLVVPVRALVHITASGSCDRYVVLDLPGAFERWLGAFLAGWRLQPAQAGGQAAESWMLYSARVEMSLAGIDSTDVKVLADRPFLPIQAEASSH